MNKKNIVFLGTPAFAAKILEDLINADYNIIAVVSQPDALVGRKRILTPTPVKEVALKYNLPVYQPASIRKEHDFIMDMDVDLLITAAYGQFIPHDMLEHSKINNINVHGSLLPRHRGGAPIQRSIINGDEKTGITIIKMVDKMDAGVMYAKSEVIIDENINSSELFVKLADVGSELLLRVLPDILENKLKGEEQQEELVTFSPNIAREEEKIDFTKSVKEVHNLIRGLATTPGAYCIFKGKSMKIYESRIHALKADAKEVGSLDIEGKNTLLVKCNDGYLEIVKLQLEGKQAVLARDFLNGTDKKALVLEKLS